MFRLVSVSKAPCLLPFVTYFFFWFGGSQAQYIGPECFTFRKDNLLQNCWDTFFLYSYPLFANLRARGDTPSERQCPLPLPPPPEKQCCEYVHLSAHEGTFVSTTFLFCLAFLFPLNSSQHQLVQHCPGGGGEGTGTCVFLSICPCQEAIKQVSKRESVPTTFCKRLLMA